MKKSFTLICLFAGLSAFSEIKPTNGSTQPTSNQMLVSNGYSAAVRVSSDELQSLTSAYQSAIPGTQGGMISKADLKALIESMPDNDTYVNFRFCIDPSGQTSLMLMGGKTWYEGKSKIDCMRNGGSAKAFCPSNCMFENAEGSVTVDLSYNDFNALSDVFKEKNPNITWGGNIDKDALMEIIGSLGDNANIGFMFGTDPSFKQTAVIFIGGGGLNYRNGVTADAFCPNMCSVRD